MESNISVRALWLSLATSAAARSKLHWTENLLLAISTPWYATFNPRSKLLRTSKVTRSPMPLTKRPSSGGEDSKKCGGWRTLLPDPRRERILQSRYRQSRVGQVVHCDHESPIAIHYDDPSFESSVFQ